MVSNLQQWTLADVYNNLEGGHLWRHGDANGEDFPVAITGIEEALAKLRTFTASISIDASATFANFSPRSRKPKAARTISTLDQSGDVTNQEFATFFHVLRYFDEDSDIIKSDSSSALKASNFIVYFILPPFFSSFTPHFEFKQ
ncbi:hypothetical protein AZE42_06212 [Rhizopogon vesiculosus]|uniref:Uncharacterized protein n=1 Tax=Rhizopogon vesiculosus TaxID=180088 RepID=A0A1J8QXX3_9AGAM|nr:hypothetical protein AZE42_06212 [Rhizopogon vesiculosus]